MPTSTLYNNYLDDKIPSYKHKYPNANSSKMKSIIQLKKQLDKSLVNYTKEHTKYKNFMKNHVHMKKTYEGKVNNQATVTVNNSETQGYFTENAYFLPSSIGSIKGNSCAKEDPIHLGDISSISPGMSDPTDGNDKFMIGKSISNQPCSAFGQNVYVNKPKTVKNKNVNYEGCFPHEANHLYEQTDLGNTTYQECKTRTEDLGAKVFALQGYQESSGGKCFVGNEQEEVTKGSTIIHNNMSLGLGSGNSPDAKLTLLKNGKLILWDCVNDSCNDSDGTSLSNKNIPYDETSNTMKSTILWSSTDHGGSTEEKCHEYYGGNINNINATWGANCTADPSAFITT